jgi:DNA modification methylase
MAVMEQIVNEHYALYNADCIEVMRGYPDESVHLSVYSPPFAGLYQYSSDERDLSNCLNRDEFFQHYGFVVRELHRLTLPGRMSAVHCTDVPTGNSGLDHLLDLPGEIIRLHATNGWSYVARYHVWKEPLTVRNRTMTKSLSHKALTTDSTKCSIANADYLLIFRRSGKNEIPVAHPHGLTDYAGERKVPSELLQYRNWEGNQIENRYSQWVWRQYASAFWDDVRLDRVLPHRKAREDEDEKHCHPLQLDVIERACIMWSNPGEVVLTPFMGVGSEVYGAVLNGRKGVGIELKTSYYHQAVLNVEAALKGRDVEQTPLFAGVEAEDLSA